MLGLITRGWLVYGCRLFRPRANSYGRGWDFEGWKTTGNYSFGNGGRWKLFNSSLKYRFRFFIEREHRSFQLYLYSFVIFFNLIFFFCFFIVITMTNENKFRPSLVPIFSRISKNPKGNIKLILILKLFQKLYHDSKRIHEESSNTGDLPRIMQQSFSQPGSRKNQARTQQRTRNITKHRIHEEVRIGGKEGLVRSRKRRK